MLILYNKAAKKQINTAKEEKNTTKLENISVNI